MINRQFSNLLAGCVEQNKNTGKLLYNLPVAA